MVLPCVESDDRFPSRDALVAAHSEARSPCVLRELCDGDEGAYRRVRGHPHDCARGILSERWAASLGNLVRTAGYHEVRTADGDGDDGDGSSEDWKQCGIIPNR